MPKKRTKRNRKQKGKGRTSRFFKNLISRKTPPIMPENNEEIQNINLKVSEKPTNIKGTRKKFFNRLFSSPSISPVSSNNNIDLLDKEPSNKINFNEEYYNSRNNSPINIDEKDIDVEDVNLTIGGKKRKYKKRK
jgi:hypothetical protein